MVEVLLINQLLSHAGLFALVSSRVWPGKLPERATLPAVTLQRIGGSPEDSHSGGTAMTPARYQVSAWGSTYLSANSVALEIVSALRHFASGAVLETFVSNRLDRTEADTGMYQCLVEVTAWVKE